MSRKQSSHGPKRLESRDCMSSITEYCIPLIITPETCLAILAKKHVTVFVRKRKTSSDIHKPKIIGWLCSEEIRNVKNIYDRNIRIHICMYNLSATPQKKIRKV